jgi:nucleoside-diphosphate-sugar epimerase
MKRVLLTGCTGWLGQTIVPYFGERYEIDVLSRQPGTSLTGDASTIRLDGRYDYIIHGALDGAQNILDQSDGAKVLLLSSWAVYNQMTPYAIAKRADEHVCFGHARIARLFSFIGPNMPNTLRLASSWPVCEIASRSPSRTRRRYVPTSTSTSCRASSNS